MDIVWLVAAVVFFVGSCGLVRIFDCLQTED